MADNEAFRYGDDFSFYTSQPQAHTPQPLIYSPENKEDFGEEEEEVETNPIYTPSYVNAFYTHNDLEEQGEEDYREKRKGNYPSSTGDEEVENIVSDREEGEGNRVFGWDEGEGNRLFEKEGDMVSDSDEVEGNPVFERQGEKRNRVFERQVSDVFRPQADLQEAQLR